MFFAAAVLVLLLAQPVHAETVSVIVNGNLLQPDVPPTIINDRTLVPLRAIFEATGADVNWDPISRGITASRQSTDIRLFVDDKVAFVNGIPIELDVPPLIISDRTMVPVRFIAESLGASVDWDASSRTVLVTLEDGVDAETSLIRWDGANYEGERLDGVPHGEGILSWDDGDVLEGIFEHGEVVEGTYTWADGTRYIGTFQDGQRAKGDYYWPNGDVYSGDFEDGEMHGIGRLEQVDGQIYEGQFRNGLYHGEGYFYWPNGDSYTGKFVDGYRTGFGTYTWDNGEEYVGEFQDGEMDGEGTYYWPDGSWVEGTWSYGELVSTTGSSADAETDVGSEPSYDAGYFTGIATGDLHLVGQDRENTYLGQLTTNEFASDSVFNDFGTYGSEFSRTSIWNDFSTFGSEFSTYSAFNSFARQPPIIVRVSSSGASIIGYVTKNQFMQNAVDPDALYMWLRQNGY